MRFVTAPIPAGAAIVMACPGDEVNASSIVAKAVHAMKFRMIAPSIASPRTTILAGIRTVGSRRDG
jgi:hypothetical protein